MRYFMLCIGIIFMTQNAAANNGAFLPDTITIDPNGRVKYHGLNGPPANYQGNYNNTPQDYRLYDGRGGVVNIDPARGVINYNNPLQDLRIKNPNVLF